MPVTHSWNDAGRDAARRRRLQVLGLVAVIVVAAAVWAYGNRSGTASTEELSSRDVGGGRTVDTSPFNPAAADVTGSTTIPDGALEAGDRNGSTTTSVVPSTTSTTIPIPAAPTNDPICGSATSILEALRIVTGPGGTSPGSLRLAAARFNEAAFALEATKRQDLQELIGLIRKVADEIPSATNPDQATAIFNQLLAPSDPALQPVSQEFTDHLSRTCPAVLSIEP